ncbi:MAG: hypothetical protein PHQ34_13470 [Methanothrix sp.]|nr:hypothetical protein [Methanothrix sp.]
MNSSFSVPLIALLLLLSGQADASFWFQVKEITPIEMMPNSEANLSVYVKGLGSERAYVELVFKNVTDGFDFSCPKMIKNVFPAGVTQYNCSVKAADVPPGNYSFVVDVAAKGAPSGKKTGFINVLAPDGGRAMQSQDGSMSSGSVPSGSMASQPAPQENSASQAGDSSAGTPTAQTRNTPASGAAAAILALLLAFRRMAG